MAISPATYSMLYIAFEFGFTGESKALADALTRPDAAPAVPSAIPFAIPFSK